MIEPPQPPAIHLLGCLLATGLAVMASPAVAQPSDSPTTTDTPSNAYQNPETGGPGESLRERIEFSLSGYHGDADRETLDELGPPDQVAAQLKRLVKDRDARTSLRTRAATLLAEYEEVDGITDFAQDQLQQLTDRASQDSLSQNERHAADLVLQALMPTVTRLSDPGRAVELLSDHLRATDHLQRQLAALHALGRHGGELGLDALRTFRSETDPADNQHRPLRSALDTYLEE